MIFRFKLFLYEKSQKNIKNQQKRNHTLHHDYDNKASDSQQRIYSQNSQQNSYKNSLKCSPEKEEQKKKVITLDIT